MQKDLYIYIPGLGGNKLIWWQKKILKGWRDQRSEVGFLEPRWHSDKKETCEQKKARLSEDIGKIISANKEKRICLLGVSAGGSLTLDIFKELNGQIGSCVLVASKHTKPDSIGRPIRKLAPALYDAVAASEKIAENCPPYLAGRILLLKPLADEVVPARQMYVKGAHARRILFISHLLSIGYCISADKSAIKRWHRSVGS